MYSRRLIDHFRGLTTFADRPPRGSLPRDGSIVHQKLLRSSELELLRACLGRKSTADAHHSVCTMCCGSMRCSRRRARRREPSSPQPPLPVAAAQRHGGGQDSWIAPQPPQSLAPPDRTLRHHCRGPPRPRRSRGKRQSAACALRGKTMGLGKSTNSTMLRW